MATRTTFPKKEEKICSLVPQKARAWAVASIEINTDSRSRTKILYMSFNIHLRLDGNGCTVRPRQKEPYFNNEESPD